MLLYTKALGLVNTPIMQIFVKFAKKRLFSFSVVYNL